MMNDDAFNDDFEDDEFDEEAEAGPSEGGGVGLCMVLLRQADLDPAIVESELRKEFGDDIEFEQGEKESITSCTIDDQHLFCMHMALPIPEQEAEGAAESFLWPDGPRAVAEHQSHVIVTSIGGGEVTDRVVTAARGARAVLQAADSIGVYWGNGSIANNTETFLMMSDGVNRQTLPLYLFMRFQLFAGDKPDTVGLYTLGLEQFGKREIEVQNSKWKPGDILEFVYNVAHYIITSGATIEDGNTVGGTKEERITVRYELSKVDPERTVMRIYLP